MVRLSDKDLAEVLTMKDTLKAKYGAVADPSVKKELDTLVHILATGDLLVDQAKITLQIASLEGRVGLVETILTNFSVEAKDRRDAAVAAASKGYLKVIELLLIKGGIVAAGGAGTASSPLPKGGDTLFEETLKIRGIKTTCCEKIAFSALKKNDLATVEILLENKSISENSLGEAVKYALSTHSLEVIAYLLTGSVTSEKLRSKVIEWAIKKEEIGTLKALLSGYASEEHRGRAVVWAIQYNALGLIKPLLEGPPLTEKQRDLAATVALENNHLDMLGFLFANGPISAEVRLKIFLMAIERNHFPIFLVILEGGLSIRHRGQGIIAAVKYNNLAMLSVLDGEVLIEDRCEAFIEAARTNNTIIFQILLAKYGHHISEEVRGGALKFAIINHNLTMFRFLLEGKILEKDGNEAVVCAAKNNRLDMVLALLKRFDLLQESRDDAIISAAEHNNLAMAKALLEGDGSDISKKARGIAVLWAAEHNNLAMAKALLEGDESDILEEERGVGVRVAIKNNNLPMLRFLLEGKISKEYRSQALLDAAKKNQFDMVALLLKHGDILEKSRGEAVRCAADNNYFDIAKALLEGDGSDISEEDRGIAVQLVVLNVNNNLPMLQFFLEGKISEKRRSQALLDAAKKNQFDMVALLLKHGDILQEYRDFAIGLAAKNNNLPMVLTLLKHGDILQKYRDSAVRWAAENNNLDMANVLLQGHQHEISEETRGMAISWAAKHNNLDLFLLFLEGNISHKHRGEAIIEAVKNNNLVIVETLLLRGPILHTDKMAAIEKATALGYTHILASLRPAAVIEFQDVHAGSREITTIHSIKNFYLHQGVISNDQIEDAYKAFCKHLETQETLSDHPTEEQKKEKNLKAKALHALIGPKVSDETIFGSFIGSPSDASVGMESFDPKAFIARLWIFISRIKDEKDKSVAMYGMVAALADAVLDNRRRVCNFGKVQRLIIAVLQGRLAHICVEKDDIGIKEVSIEVAVRMFYSDERVQAIKKLSELLREANAFCSENTLVNKSQFLDHLVEHSHILVAESDIDDIDAFRKAL